MKNVLTFIIPVRHPENATAWSQIKKHLSETVLSISRQTALGWKAVVVANEGAALPDLPPQFEIRRVDFPPNPMAVQGDNDLEDFYNAIRLDKGRRILAGMLHAGVMGHVMIVDEDDFVSRNLTAYVAANPRSNGWFIRDGYIWSGGELLYRYADFSGICGSSHIVRADLYNIPSHFEDANETYIRSIGSHIFLREQLDAAGTPLSPLPFEGAVARTAHSQSTISSQTIFGRFFLSKRLLLDPIELCRRISRLRFRTARLRQEFFGETVFDNS